MWCVSIDTCVYTAAGFLRVNFEPFAALLNSSTSLGGFSVASLRVSTRQAALLANEMVLPPLLLCQVDGSHFSPDPPARVPRTLLSTEVQLLLWFLCVSRQPFESKDTETLGRAATWAQS